MRAPEWYVAQFWKHVVKTENCWNYVPIHLKKMKPGGATSRTSQYAMHWDGSRTQLAHRFSFALHGGKLPNDTTKWTVDHTCENKKCVNPEHLELVTRSVNSIRRGERARRTHCPHGHEMTEENTYVSTDQKGHRTHCCKSCKRGRARARYRAQANLV